LFSVSGGGHVLVAERGPGLNLVVAIDPGKAFNRVWLATGDGPVGEPVSLAVLRDGVDELQRLIEASGVGGVPVIALEETGGLHRAWATELERRWPGSLRLFAPSQTTASACAPAPAHADLPTHALASSRTCRPRTAPRRSLAAAPPSPQRLALRHPLSHPANDQRSTQPTTNAARSQRPTQHAANDQRSTPLHRSYVRPDRAGAVTGRSPSRHGELRPRASGTVLSIGKLTGGANSARYYEQTVATGREDYYSGRGEGVRKSV
jgi:hypothetical protein